VSGKFSCKILGEILMRLSRESFVKKIQTFVPKVSGNFRVKFRRKFVTATLITIHETLAVPCYQEFKVYFQVSDYKIYSQIFRNKL